jgi:hypothetical protein
MENIFYVYLHRRKTDNKVFFVGRVKIIEHLIRLIDHDGGKMSLISME